MRERTAASRPRCPPPPPPPPPARRAARRRTPGRRTRRTERRRRRRGWRRGPAPREPPPPPQPASPRATRATPQPPQCAPARPRGRSSLRAGKRARERGGERRGCGGRAGSPARSPANSAPRIAVAAASSRSAQASCTRRRSARSCATFWASSWLSYSDRISSHSCARRRGRSRERRMRAWRRLDGPAVGGPARAFSASSSPPSGAAAIAGVRLRRLCSAGCGRRSVSAAAGSSNGPRRRRLWRGRARRTARRPQFRKTTSSLLRSVATCVLSVPPVLERRRPIHCRGARRVDCAPSRRRSWRLRVTTAVGRRA